MANDEILVNQSNLPSSPSIINAQVKSEAQINLLWTSNNTADAIIHIERKKENESFQEITKTSNKTDLFEDKILQPNHVYTYRLTASNSFGRSAYSNEVKASTNFIATNSPNAPTNLHVRNHSDVSVDLEWNDNSSNETYFVVQRRICTNNVCIDKSFDSIAQNIGADQTRYTDIGVIPDTLYEYQIFAINSAGSSQFSNTTSVRTDSTPPPGTQKPVPPIVTAKTLSSTSIEILWTDQNPPEALIDEVYSIAKYEINSTTGLQANRETKWISVNPYVWENLLPNTTYYFVMRSRTPSLVNNEIYSDESVPVSSKTAVGPTIQLNVEIEESGKVESILVVGEGSATINCTKDDAGNVTGTCAASFTTNAVITLRPIVLQDVLYTFDHWVGCNQVTTDNRCQIMMSNTKTVIAVFSFL